MESCNHCHGSGENCSPASVSDRAFLSQRPCSKTLRNSCATIYFSLICQITVTGEVPTGEFKGRSLGSYYSQKEEPVQFWEKEAKIRWQSSPAKKNSCGGVPARSAVGRHAEMATFEEQTKCVVEALFSDLLGEEGTDCRNLETDSEEPAQPAGEPPIPFDPVVVASRLRRMGDQCNVDFERVSSEPLAEVLKGKTEKFGAAVDSLIRSWSDQNPELVYETAFLSVSVKLLTHVAKKGLAMVHPNQLINMINGNSQVRSYIEACGGWENLDN
ncbi:bcl-2-like protein 15 isoform X2 [Calonectris borealis]|uniref:bcl-2-like protein 15 isoform X2 n=1 Tax=Calonectris borealis TaxID=1323832 RepID=UPI003F4B0B7D